MAGLESDTVGGFNSMIEKQKKEPGRAYVSTVLFDNVSEVFTRSRTTEYGTENDRKRLFCSWLYRTY